PIRYGVQGRAGARLRVRDASAGTADRQGLQPRRHELRRRVRPPRRGGIRPCPVNAIRVTVIYALPERQTEIELSLPSGATVVEALERCGLAAIHPEIDLARSPVGIFGRRVERDRVLAHGDRVEIYRALIANPKAARRRRAQGRDSG